MTNRNLTLLGETFHEQEKKWIRRNLLLPWIRRNLSRTEKRHLLLCEIFFFLSSLQSLPIAPFPSSIQNLLPFSRYFVEDGEMDGERAKKMVFVTVGTTCFDALIKAVDAQRVKDELLRRGFTQLVIQMGRGTYIPSKNSGEDGSLAVDYFTFSPSIDDYLRSASLIISHAGSGSIFETLRLGKPLIVVVNEDLMDNHQSELAEELAERKHLFCARPQTLHQTVKEMNLESLLAYQPGDAMPVVKLINRFLGFPSDI